MEVTADNLLDQDAKLDIDNPDHRVAGMHRLLAAIGAATNYLDGWTQIEEIVREFRVYFLEDVRSVMADLNSTGILISGPVYDTPNDLIYALIITENGRLFHWETSVRLSTRTERASNPDRVYAVTALSSEFTLLTADTLDKMIRGPLGKRLFANANRRVIEILEAMQVRVLTDIFGPVTTARRVNWLFS